MTRLSTATQMMQYTAWANQVMLQNASLLPVSEIEAERDTLFKSISSTFDHILVVEEIFHAHLEGRAHGFRNRFREQTLPFKEVKNKLLKKDQLLLSLVETWSEEERGEQISFRFVDSQVGCMSREEIILHLSHHASYHRGFISTLIYPFKVKMAASDLTVFLRDVWPSLTKS